MSNVLKEVSEGNLGPLVAECEKHLPKSTTVFGFLSMTYKYGDRKIGNSKIYVPEDPNLPLFVVITGIKAMRTQSINVFWDSNLMDKEKAISLLKVIPNVNWTERILFSAIHDEIHSQITEAIENGRLGNGKLKQVRVEQDFIHTAKPETIIKPRLPENFHLRSLEEEDGKIVYDTWFYKDFDTEKSVRSQVAAYPSFGACTQDGSLVAWSVAKSLGDIGHTYTLKEYRRKGLASATTVRVAQELLKDGLHPYVLIPEGHKASVKLHENLGFMNVASIIWSEFDKQS